MKKFLLVRVHELKDEVDAYKIIGGQTHLKVENPSVKNKSKNIIFQGSAAETALAIKKRLSKEYELNEMFLTKIGFLVRSIIRKKMEGSKLTAEEFKIEKIRNEFGLSHSYFSKMLQIMRLSDQQLKVAAKERIGLSKLYPIARIKNPKTRSEVFMEAVENRYSEDYIKEIVNRSGVIGRRFKIRR